MEISRTALNLPQLFKCSFSRRKKFQTNRRKTSSGAKIDVIKSPLMILFSVSKKDKIHTKRSKVSSMIAKQQNDCGNGEIEEVQKKFFHQHSPMKSTQFPLAKECYRPRFCQTNPSPSVKTQNHFLKSQRTGILPSSPTSTRRSS